MPQMSPMMWLVLMLMFIMLFFFFIIFFFFKYKFFKDTNELINLKFYYTYKL